MNVKITDKQANRTTEDKTSDPFDENKFLTNCLMVAFDEIFRWRNFFAVQYGRHWTNIIKCQQRVFFIYFLFIFYFFIFFFEIIVQYKC